jgi:DNA-directed RNA polymerase alpha subunit
MKLKNFGKKSLDEIREKLMEHNLSLRDEGDDNEPEQEEQDET